jgi:nucleotide-binding universal stress UspA family protein
MDQTFRSPQYNPSSVSKARDDFRRARRRAALEKTLASLTGKPAGLLPYDEVRSQLKFQASVDRGIQEIPLRAIVGSVGRYEDFTRSFLPTNPTDEVRWANVKVYMEDEGAPPIEVYQIGDAYFVMDGNHRVSIARQSGLDFLPAHVTEIKTRVPLSHQDNPEQVVCKARYADFLEQSRLDELRPGCDLSMTLCDQYDLLLGQIEAHRYFLWLEHQEELPLSQVVADWYDRQYLPVVLGFREQGILLDFPELTEADLYILITEHRLDLQKQLGWELDTPDAAANYAQIKRPPVVVRFLNAVTPPALHAGPETGQWRRQRLAQHDKPSLFIDILVAGQGLSAVWSAVDHAILVAQREAARLRGLSLLPDSLSTGQERLDNERLELDRRSRLAGVRSEFTVEVGPTAPTLLQRTAWVDLLVLSLPPQDGRLANGISGSDFEQILHHSARPILAVPPGSASTLDRAVLAYNGSPKADEALYAAAYLALRWEISLVVVHASPKSRADESLNKARAYLEGYQVIADYIDRTGPPARSILEIAASHAANLIIIGGHGQRPLAHLLVGSTVHDVLRRTSLPVLICR